VAWAAKVLRTVLPVAGRWENEGTSTTEVAVAAAAGTVGDGPTVVAECKSCSTSLEHPQNYP
jgi:hypothetical protein